MVYKSLGVVVYIESYNPVTDYPRPPSPNRKILPRSHSFSSHWEKDLKVPPPLREGLEETEKPQHL